MILTCDPKNFVKFEDHAFKNQAEYEAACHYLNHLDHEIREEHLYELVEDWLYHRRMDNNYIFNKDEPGICPVCTSDALKGVGDSYDVGHYVHSWKCCKCGAAGDEIYNETEQFMGHDDVHDKDGNEWFSAEEGQ